MSDTAKLYLLGGFRLETPEAAPVEIASLKGRALLAYLACIRDHQATREQLSMLLWNEGTGRKPRQNLRQALLKLRRGLAARGLSILLSANGRIALRRDALWVDVWEYDSLAADGRRPALERMDRLYRGEFLHDVRVDFESVLFRLDENEYRKALVVAGETPAFLGRCAGG